MEKNEGFCICLKKNNQIEQFKKNNTSIVLLSNSLGTQTHQ